MLIADGGGKVMAALNPIQGADRIACFFIGIVGKFGPLNGGWLRNLCRSMACLGFWSAGTSRSIRF
ncbi:hypothetical protein NT2_06_01845 [Caenibius tardaugens NBRC 16725]|uniref:Uncharacterized protein n=1 Tax=Caenibius tardaugens NBRC 16725 TaxID=1219035 RepID=U2YM27_9SPHN|nr:hypothetical protein NT2_06_01845 [Caenibius tardaugens NBRC 16725]